MGRAPCCDKGNVKKGPWSPEEDATLKDYIEKNGTGGNWIALPHKIGLRRCGKSCRLRWLNYLRPNIKHGEFSPDEDRIICTLFANIGSRWSIIAAQLPGRTDNDIKNYWNTKLKKKLMGYNNINNNSNNNPHKIIISPNAKIITTTLFPPNIPSNYNSFLHSQIPPPPPYDQCGNSNFSYTTTTTPIRVYDQPNLISPSPNNGFVGSTDQGNNRMLMFGGGSDNQRQPSCSSSDGSCITNNQQIISNNGDHDQNYCFQSYLSNSGFDQENEKFMFSGNDEVNAVVDHSIEEIKELISTNHHMCNNLNSFFVDEIKIEDKLLDY